MRRVKFLIIPMIVLVAGGLGALEWYRSSASGIPGSLLRAATGPEEIGWSLSIENSSTQEIRKLYLDGDPQSSSIFYRANGRLVAREELDPDGTVISRVEYAYDIDGNPRAIYIGIDENPDSSKYVETSTRVNADGNINRHSSGSDGDWIVTDLNTSGQTLNRTTLQSGAIVEKSNWIRNDDGSLKEEIHQRGNEVHRNRFDSDGRLLEETVARNESVILLRTYTWSDGNLIRVEERGEGRTVVREMKWSDNRIVNELREVDGVPVSIVDWQSPDERVETLFRDGKAIIRVYWLDDVRIKEEFLRDGEILRVREVGP